MHAQYDQPAKGGQSSNRQFCRGDVAIVADIRIIGGSKTKIKVVDISQTGFRMECLTFMSGSQTIFLTIPSFQQMEARIEWQTEWIYGCRFVRPLYAAIFDHIVKTYPALEEVSKPNTTGGMMYGAAAGLQWASR